MATTAPRFASTNTAAKLDLQLDRRASTMRSAESLRREASDALSQRDLSDVVEQEHPAADSDATLALLLIERAERRLWEVEQALERMDNGTYGYCAGCGAGQKVAR